MIRRLAAILAADVAGYSRLMGEDETGTLGRLKGLIEGVVEPVVAEHRGRVVKLMGDGLLVEFASVVDAVECAAAWQARVAEQAGDLRFRIGINLGDVIFDDGDIFGDGVNVAARLEGLAAPGEVCVSGKVYQEVKAKLPLTFDDLGEKQVKNIADPIRVYRLSCGAPEAVAVAVAPPAKPAIIVLPLTNMSDDPEQAYFSDGIAEDITTALSRFHELLVIARNTAFTFKGQAVKVKELARELGVTYVLEGSVRRAGNRVRVTVQLIDAGIDAHIWAERYDRDLDDIFAVQDEITEKIVATVAPETINAEMVRASAKPAPDLSAWERVMRARWHMDKLTKADNQAAHGLLREASEMAPGMAQAFSTDSLCHLNDMLHVWSPDPLSAIEAAGQAARQAIAIDGSDATGLAALGLVVVFARNYEDAVRYLTEAVRLNPNLANGYGFMATVQGLMGDDAAASAAFDKALRLSPRDPDRFIWLAGKGIGLYTAERYEEAVENARVMLRENLNFATAHRQMSASLAMLGRDDEARAAMARLRALMPDLTLSRVPKMIPVKDPGAEARWLEGLRRAGLPE